MELEHVMRERHSTRAFPEKTVSRDAIEILFSLCTRARSPINLQPWEFTVVMGEECRPLSRLLVKRMREKDISCGPDAVRPLPACFMDRQQGLMDWPPQALS